MSAYRIFIFTSRYTPAYKAGGPIRTLQAVVDRLGDEFIFYLLTLDRDLGDLYPFSDVFPDKWQSVGNAQVYYISPTSCSLMNLRRLLRDTPHDLLYVNSFFDPVFTILVLALRRLDLIPRRPVVLAPRGELSPAALQLKSAQKQVYIRLARLLGLYRDVYWQASSEQEEKNIVRGFFGNTGQSKQSLNIVVAPDLVPVYNETYPRTTMPKERGSLRIVFLSRISPMKNLEFAIDAIGSLVGRVIFNIYGPVNDIPYEQAYWARCSKLLQGLPANITATYHGPVNPTEVSQIMASHDLFILPTLGENFGHVIVESLSSGCPVLISDRTPWHNLAAHHAGWDLPLEKPQAFRDVMQSLVDMDEVEYAVWRDGARAYAQSYLSDNTNLERQRQLFLTALGGYTL